MVEQLVCAEVSELHHFGGDPDLTERIPDPEVLEHPYTVSGDLPKGADLTELPGLLVKFDVDTLRAISARGGRAPIPAPMTIALTLRLSVQARVGDVTG